MRIKVIFINETLVRTRANIVSSKPATKFAGFLPPCLRCYGTQLSPFRARYRDAGIDE